MHNVQQVREQASTDIIENYKIRQIRADASRNTGQTIAVFINNLNDRSRESRVRRVEVSNRFLCSIPKTNRIEARGGVAAKRRYV